MQPDKWKEVKGLFNKALGLPAQERAEYLRQECAGDDSMRRLVESLLKAHDRSDSFMDWPAATLLLNATPELRPGEIIARYEIRGLLGVGGMGRVYRAWDTSLKRDVALKVLLAEPGENDRHKRFVREARAAAALDHPNICSPETGTPVGEAFKSTLFMGHHNLEGPATNK